MIIAEEANLSLETMPEILITNGYSSNGIGPDGLAASQ